LEQNVNYDSTSLDSTGVVLSTMPNNSGTPLVWPQIFATYLGIYDTSSALPEIPAYRDPIAVQGSGVILFID